MIYCSTCGNRSESVDLFCSSCGNSLENNGSERKNEKLDLTHEFSSNILLGGSIFTPDKISINQNGVTYTKRNKYLIGKDRVHMSFENISSVRINRKLIDADIIISGRGTIEIVAKDFSISNARKIEKLIKTYL
ncbi:MAG: hypothetical protein ABF260_06315 [Flavobacteriaceae bacterium]